ncbi:hypothetical protein TGRUB_286480 [Toxoplasma gondii RUB]|uniref:Uncharacterized protein n=3 Tax=Toxoplasma gondii TaxID=5811 RepID=A0A086M2W2_TOXGO|nr:hypothetical protein TGRUB_286480 [Toxoplasma gondii RUB]
MGGGILHELDIDGALILVENQRKKVCVQTVPGDSPEEATPFLHGFARGEHRLNDFFFLDWSFVRNTLCFNRENVDDPSHLSPCSFCPTTVAPSQAQFRRSVTHPFVPASNCSSAAGLAVPVSFQRHFLPPLKIPLFSKGTLGCLNGQQSTRAAFL